MVSGTRWTWLRTSAATATLAALAACGGGGGGGDSTAASTPGSGVAAASGGPGTGPASPVAPAPAPEPLSAQSLQFLDLDMANLADYTPVLPRHYQGIEEQDNAPTNLASTPAVAALGRVLFHDKRMSINNAVSCASCHLQDGGFADKARFSIGFDGTSTTTAHAMRLANLRWFAAGSMFWDRRSASLEAQATQPLQHPVEMGFDEPHGGIRALVAKMEKLPYYPELFTAAFGESTISEERIGQALSQFMRGIVSTNSRWDTGYAQVFDPALPDKGVSLPVPGLTEQENRGRHLFMAKPAQGGANCAVCHVPPTFALAGGSNGLEAGETRRFKSPSLKNVAKSAAFMHDGRFSTLEEVVEHYDSGVLDGPSLDGRLRGADGKPFRLNLNDDDKRALVAFLKTLDDPVLAADPRFADPFR